MNTPISRHKLRARQIAYAATLFCASFGAHADEAAPAVADSTAAVDSSTPGVQKLQRVEITDKRNKLDEARNALSPETGSSIYRFSDADIAKLPLGDATPLNQVLLRAPGVVQDSFAAGQLHVRGDHANLQYRLNGVVLPESVGGFSSVLDTRFASQVSLLTGALPAQYGYRTAGVIDIQTKGDSTGNGGSVSFTGGSLGHAETSVSLYGSSDRWSWFVVGSSLNSEEGIENPTDSRKPLHDETHQQRGLGYLSYLIDDDSQVSLLMGSTNNHFEIPDVPDQQPQFTLAGTPPLDSSDIDARQTEHTTFQVLSYQSKIGMDIDYQVALFNRASDVHYLPDPVGDLTYSGVAANILRSNRAQGLQFDLTDRLNEAHTLRAGLFTQHESGQINNSSSVFMANDDGTQATFTPTVISDDSRLGGNTLGAYLQDEWKVSSALTINYGLRADKVSTVVDEHQLSPRLGLVYDLGSGTRLHAGYARYFTPPPTEIIDQTSVQKFLGTTNALPSDANTAVKSERSNYLDAGISQEIDGKLTLGIDAYYRNVHHLQDEGQFGQAFVFSAFNYNLGRIYGLELSASYHDKHLSGYANLATESARAKGVETGQYNFEQDELDYISTHWVHVDHEEHLTGSAGLSWLFDEGTTLGGDLLFGSGLRNGFANTTHLPSHLTLNLSAAHSFDFGGAFGKLDTRVSLLNAFDRSYELRDGSGISVGAPQFGQLRSVFVSLSKPFSF